MITVREMLDVLQALAPEQLDYELGLDTTLLFTGGPICAYVSDSAKQVQIKHRYTNPSV